MPKSRKRQPAKSSAKARRIRIDREARTLAAQIVNQDHLAAVLLEVEDPFERKAMFDYVRPMLKFNAQFPTKLATATPHLVLP
jgi:hypothetical protein